MYHQRTFYDGSGVCTRQQVYPVCQRREVMVCFSPLFLDNDMKVWFIQSNKCSGICANDEQNQCKWEYHVLLLLELLLFPHGIPIALEELTPSTLNIKAMGRPEGVTHGFIFYGSWQHILPQSFLIP